MNHQAIGFQQEILMNVIAIINLLFSGHPKHSCQYSLWGNQIASTYLRAMLLVEQS
jgi:hypothetical protein